MSGTEETSRADTKGMQTAPRIAKENVTSGVCECKREVQLCIYWWCLCVQLSTAHRGRESRLREDPVPQHTNAIPIGWI